MRTTLQGDLIALALDNQFDVIVHGCNCFCTMGAGIAKSIKQYFPAAYQVDLATIKGDRDKLGSMSYAKIEQGNQTLYVVNAYTQYHYRGKGVKVDYEALRQAFQEIKKQFTGLRIAYPAIGAGLAGGNWALISQIIEDELVGEEHVFVKFRD